MRTQQQRALIKLAQEAHAELQEGVRIGNRPYRLTAAETWDCDLERIICFCAEDSGERFPKVAKFQPAQAEALLDSIAQNHDRYKTYFLKYVKDYYWGKRALPCPTVNTQTDPALGLVLRKSCADLSAADIPRALDHHRKLMVAENTVGQLLERYVYSKTRQNGWIWCAGNVIRFVDFYVPDRKPTRLVLQIKNQANSENSASSSVRAGTETVKWFRRNSKSGATKWEKLETLAGVGKGSLSEQEFQGFVRGYTWAPPEVAAEPDEDTEQ